MIYLCWLVAGSALLWAGQASPERDRDTGSGLAGASLEELMNMEISSMARKRQKISHTAAAVFVITQEDIARSGAVSLPEVLRLAPGLQVARIDGSKWAISSRGFNGRFANKMLVLIDGRSVYTPLYSGTYWDQNDILLEDIDRIEVIRGPGATTWGANAVNGVINIITKPASATAGALATFSGGPGDDRYTGMRFGGKAGKRVHYRLFGRMSHTAGFESVEGDSTFDTQRAGGRLEWAVNSRDTLTVHADGYRGDSAQTVSESLTYLGPLRPRTERIGIDGGYAQVQWRRAGERSEAALQGYLNSEQRNEGAGDLRFRTVDFDYQHRYGVSRRHDVVWGAGLRQTADEVRLTAGYSARPESRTTGLASAFVQDDISLIGDKLIFSVGSKFLHQQYSGPDWQPGVRLLWAPDNRNSIWTSVTRAVRTPSRRDQDISFEFALPATLAPQGAFARYQGSRDFSSEAVASIEAGYRHQIGDRFSIDLALFRSNYTRLQSLQPGNPILQLRPGPRVIIPLLAANGGRALTQGGEASAQWRIARRLRLSGAHSYLSLTAPGTGSLLGGGAISRDPRHQIQARLSWDPSQRVSFDAFVFKATRLEGPAVPGWTRADVRLAWRFRPEWEISVGGRNLLDRRHIEFQPEDFVIASDARRSAYIRLTWRPR